VAVAVGGGGGGGRRGGWFCRVLLSVFNPQPAVQQLRVLCYMFYFYFKGSVF
jgi:hypothetical protein